MGDNIWNIWKCSLEPCASTVVFVCTEEKSLKRATGTAIRRQDPRYKLWQKKGGRFGENRAGLELDELISS